nr:MAG TPA: Hemagglutinin HA2 Virus, GP2 Ectodomain, Post-Fusion [Caudoviricetes sp.]
MFKDSNLVIPKLTLKKNKLLDKWEQTGREFSSPLKSILGAVRTSA